MNRLSQARLLIVMGVVDRSGLTGFLELLHPPELVHRVLQPSDPVVVKKQDLQAGQMTQSTCVGEKILKIRVMTTYVFFSRTFSSGPYSISICTNVYVEVKELLLIIKIIYALIPAHFRVKCFGFFLPQIKKLI